jgi:hypothetical protein
LWHEIKPDNTHQIVLNFCEPPLTPYRNCLTVV